MLCVNAESEMSDADLVIIRVIPITEFWQEGQLLNSPLGRGRVRG